MTTSLIWSLKTQTYSEFMHGVMENFRLLSHMSHCVSGNDGFIDKALVFTE